SLFLLLFHALSSNPDIHSFPTRRSSDLAIEWNIIPITAATAPKPAAIAKIRTHSTVGTARTIVIKPFIVLLNQGLDKFTAVPNAKNKETTAPKIVAKKPKDKVTPTCHRALVHVVLFKLGDKIICSKLYIVIGMARDKYITDY